MTVTHSTESPAVYSIRPDKSTSMVAIIGLAAFAWFANQWAGSVSTNSQEALRKAEQSLQMNERQADQIARLPTHFEQTISSAMSPLQLRLEDLSKQYNVAYSANAAERDRALVTQEIMQIKSDINANQNSIQQATGRIESVEQNLKSMVIRLEQIYQAIIAKPRGPSDMPIAPGVTRCSRISSISKPASLPAPAENAMAVPTVWTTTC